MATKVKKYQKGGVSDPVTAMYKAKGEKMPSTKKTLKYVSKHGSGYIPPSNIESTQKNNINSDKLKKYLPPTATKKYMTGGVVNPNAKIKTDKTPEFNGVRSGVNPKTSASKVTKGRVGGISAAPKTAIPKKQFGGTISENAAERKAAKGKGIYTPIEGFRKTKGLYTPLTKAGRKEVKETGGTEVYNMKKTKKIMMKTGGTVMGSTRAGMVKAGSKKYQTGGSTPEKQIESGVRKNYIANAKAKLMGVANAARTSSARKGKI